MDVSVIKHIMNVLLILAAGGFVLHFVLVNYRSSKQNNAPVTSERALAYCKHPDMEPVLVGRHSSYIYYVTFHTDSGDAVKLYMNPTSYYSIPEGSWGTLTWQGDRFWKFILEDGREIRQ